MPRSALLPLSASTFTVFILELSALLSSALQSAFGVFVPVSGSSALLLSALLFASGVFVPIPGSSAPLSILSISGVSVLVLALLAPPSVSSMPLPRLLAPPSVSGVPIFGPRLSLLPFPTWSSPQISMLVLRRQKLGQ